MRRESLEAWLRENVAVVDTATATALFLLALPLTYGVQAGRYAVLVAALTLPLALRRVAPAASYAFIAAACLGQWTIEEPPTLANAGLLLALYSVAAYATRFVSWTALAVSGLGVLLAVERYWGPFTTTRYSSILGGLMTALVLAAWIAGDLRRTRLLYESGLRERADQLERERDQQGRIVAAAERARIAREMHDVVAHGLSVMIVQADGGLYAMDRDPDAARRALSTIGTTGRESLAEMRTLLGLLRTDAPLAGSGDEVPAGERAPQPGIDQIADLVGHVRSAGMPVELDVRGQSRALPLTVGLTAYRIVQEGLTNALRHAGPGARASVTLEYAPDALDIQVVDDGRGAASLDGGSGLGLVGMRERVAVAGGAVRSGPRAGGGFEVIARLPTARVAAP